MANPFESKMESLGAKKMAHTSGSAKNYESQRDKADRRYGAPHKDTTVTDTPPKITSPKG